MIKKIPKEGYPLCKVTWVDVACHEGDLDESELETLSLPTFITYGLLLRRGSKDIVVSNTYATEPRGRVFRNTVQIPTACVVEIEYLEREEWQNEKNKLEEVKE